MTDRHGTPQDAARLHAEKSTLIELLTRQGVTGARVAVTPGYSGPRRAWASIPLDEAQQIDLHALTEAGCTVRTGALTVSITLGAAA